MLTKFPLHLKSLFLIAAYNEETSISNVIEQLVASGQPVLVVDDGSQDGTAEILRRYGKTIFVARHPVNLGQGAALQTGLTCARLLDPEYIVTFDADGQHRLSDALAMIAYLEKHPALEILLGSRFLGATTAMPKMKRITLKAGVLFTNYLSDLAITDTHNGLRVMRRDFYKRFNFQTTGMEHASEILDFIGMKRVSFEEFPVTIDYTEYSKAKGQSWTNAIKLAAKMILEKL